MGLKTFGLLLLQKLAITGLAPDTRCSLLDLCGVWSGQAQSQTTGRDARRATAIWGQLCGLSRTEASRKKDTIEMTNNLVSVERGARDLWRHPRACCGTWSFPVLTSSTQPPPRPLLSLSLVQAWLLILLRKQNGSSGVPCVLEVTTFYSLEVTCVMLVSPKGCFELILHASGGKVEW